MVQRWTSDGRDYRTEGNRLGSPGRQPPSAAIGRVLTEDVGVGDPDGSVRLHPVTVTLRPGASAWLLVAKYRCDAGIGRNATAIRITVPGAQHAVLTGRAAASGAGVSALSYCLGGVNDPGQTVAVSPIEPALQATARR
jgi:TctA family transporter